MPAPQRPETEASNEQKLSRYLTLARRAVRHWPLAAAVFVLATAIAAGVAVTRPRIYKSECLIYYKEEMRKDMLSDREAERERDLAHKLHQILWSRTRLMKIIKQFNLYPDLRAAKTEEEVVEAMRNAIEVREKGGDTFWVAYEGKDPKTVQQVDAAARRHLRRGERARRGRALPRHQRVHRARVDQGQGGARPRHGRPGALLPGAPRADPRGDPGPARAGRRGARHRQGGQERRQAAALRHQGGQPRAARHAGREGAPRGAALARVAAAAGGHRRSATRSSARRAASWPACAPASPRTTPT